MGEEYKEDKKMKKQNKKQAKRNAMFRKLRKYVKEKYDKEIAKKEKKLGRTLEKKEKIKIVDGIVAKCRDGETKFRHYCYNGPRLHFQHIDY